MPEIKPCIFVVGPAHVGKSTFIAELSAATGLPAGETGDQVLAALANYKATTGFFRRSDRDWLTQIRVNKALWRKHLIWMGHFGCAIKPTVWIDECIESGARIIGGVRRMCEVEARARAGARDFWIEIRRPGVLAVEDYCELTLETMGAFVPHNQMAVVENVGVAALRAYAWKWAAQLKEFVGE